MSGFAIEVVIAANSELGEGPFWDERSNRLVWIDILGKAIHQTDPETGATETIDVPLHVGAVVPRAAGGYIAALQDGFWVVGDGPSRRLVAVTDTGESLRFNDGKCDPDGRLWAGTMPYDEVSPVGALYCLDATGRVSRMLDAVTISNGIAWSGDGSTMFYIDTPTRRIDAFTFTSSTGAIADRRTIVEIPPGVGFPDGMTIDSEDGLWVAFWGGSAVRRYVDGRLDVEIEIPVSQPTCCAFGGPHLDELFVTSARKGLSERELAAEPLAGALFRVRVGARGVPAAAYESSMGD